MNGYKSMTGMEGREKVLAELQETMAYSFADQKLLEQALYPYDHTDDDGYALPSEVHIVLKQVGDTATVCVYVKKLLKLREPGQSPGDNLAGAGFLGYIDRVGKGERVMKEAALSRSISRILVANGKVMTKTSPADLEEHA